MSDDVRGALLTAGGLLALWTAWSSWGCPTLVDHAIASQRRSNAFPRHFTVDSTTCGGFGSEPCQSWVVEEKPRRSQ